jgi:hypothetical protein
VQPVPAVHAAHVVIDTPQQDCEHDGESLMGLSDIPVPEFMEGVVVDVVCAKNGHATVEIDTTRMPRDSYIRGLTVGAIKDRLDQGITFKDARTGKEITVIKFCDPLATVDPKAALNRHWSGDCRL